MRKIKPFDMKYRNYNVRVSNVRKRVNQLYLIKRTVFSCKLIFKSEFERFEVPIKELEARDLEAFKIQLRLILNQQNF